MLLPLIETLLLAVLPPFSMISPLLAAPIATLPPPLRVICPLLVPASVTLALPLVLVKLPVLLPPTKTLPPAFRLKVPALVPAITALAALSRFIEVVLVWLPYTVSAANCDAASAVGLMAKLEPSVILPPMTVRPSTSELALKFSKMTALNCWRIWSAVRLWAPAGLPQARAVAKHHSDRAR